MEFTNTEDILKKIKAGQLAPLYILHGEETYFTDLVTDALELVIPEHERSFNQDILYGKDISGRTILDIARQYPMMAEKRMIMVKEADSLKAAEFEALNPLFARPIEHAVVVLSFKNKIDGRLKWFKDIKNVDHVHILLSSPVRDYELSKWITRYVSGKKYGIFPDAAELLAQYLGTDLQKLVNEIDKIILQLPENGTIDAQVVDRLVGISKEFNTFELCRAIANRDVNKVHMISFYMAQNFKSVPLIVILPGMLTYFQKVLLASRYQKSSDGELAKLLGVHPGFMSEYKTAAKNYDHDHLRQIIAWLAESDQILKGVGAKIDEDQLIKELVSKILMPQLALIN